MTDINPQQMRQQADRTESVAEGLDHLADRVVLRRSAAALRTAANQLENYERDHNLVTREWHEGLMRQVKFRSQDEIEQEQAQYDDYRENTPPRIEDMAPGTTFMTDVRFLVDAHGTPLPHSGFDASTIRDVRPPKEQP
jgi:hypothetical protein